MSAIEWNSEHSDSVFSELSEMEIRLDSDPLVYGPKRLNGKIAESRKMLARCERLFLDVSQKLSHARRSLRKETLAFDMKKKHLLSNEPMVRAERSVSDRDAAASMLLKAEITEVHRLEVTVADLEDLMDVIKAKRTDLKDTQGRLRDQIRLCQEEIGLGNKWGSRVPQAREVEKGLPAKRVMTEVDTLFASLGEEEHLEAADTPTGEVDEDAVLDALLAGAEESVEAETMDQALGLPDVESMQDVLPGTGTTEDVDALLEGIPMETGLAAGRRRRQQEDLAQVDIDDILAHFSV
jgi:hypothetical protein